MRQSTLAYQAMPLSPVPYRLHRAFGLVSYTVSPLGASGSRVSACRCRT